MRATFRFRYQSLLDLRVRAEEASQRALAAAQRQAQTLRAQIEAMDQAMASSRLELADALTGQVEVSRVAAVAALGAEQQTHRRAIEREITAQLPAVEQARQDLAEASRQRRVLEQLRDRHADAWRLRQRRRDQAAMDEIAAAQWQRRGGL